ncbi:MAG TPA: hypothetical protein VN660_13680 [Steroidobacteraceae bacterium]|nr:hypothetical protein [Steroidobacteraceae bacterium]
MLGRGDILGADDLRTEEVNVPEWGGSVRVRSMTGCQREQFEQAVRDRRVANPTEPAMRALLVAYSCCDESGEPLFKEADLDRLSAKSGVALERVATVAAKLSLLTDASIEEASKN